MSKSLTKHLFRGFALLTLLVATSFVTRADYVLKGGFDGWGAGAAMTLNADGTWFVDQEITAGCEFKIFNDAVEASRQYWGYSRADAYGTATSIPWTFYELAEGGGNNMVINVAGTFRFTFNPTTHQLEVTEIPVARPVTTEVTGGNGTVTVDKSTASAGETVTVTVTPATGYYAESANVTVELTLDPGSGNAPRRAPQVGDTFGVDGDALATADAPGQYTFVMPDYPYGALVMADFQQCITLTEDMFDAIGQQDWTGSEVEPGVTPTGESGLTGDDYTVTYSDNTDEGTATVTITGTGKYTGTVTLTFIIAKAEHQVIVDENIANGTVTATPTSATAGTTITLTATPADSDTYEFASYTVTDADGNTIEVNGDTFEMPNADVNVTATFTLIPKLYLTGTFNGWGDLENGGTANPEFTRQADGTWTLTMQMPAELQFAMLGESGQWFNAPASTDGTYWITATMLGEAQSLEVGTAKNFYIEKAGEWTFTVDADRTTVTVTGQWDYAVTVDDAVSSFITASVARASATETVELTVSPEAGFSLGAITVTYGDGQTIVPTLKDGEQDVYEFAMPYADVTVTATFDANLYAITLGDGVTVNVENPAEVLAGTQVTVTVTPAEADDFVAVGIAVTADDDNVSDPTVTDNGDGTFTFTMPTSNVGIEAILEAILHGVVFDGNRQWATYYGKYNLTVPDQVQAFVVTGVENDEVTVSPVDYIPANVGVLLYSEQNMSDITTPLYDGQLTDGITSTLVGDIEAQDIATGYVLYNNVFIRSETGTLAAHRCYLPMPTAGNAPRRLLVKLPGAIDVVTAIEGICADRVATVTYVNPMGMVSAEPFSGVNIMVVTLDDGTTTTVKVLK